MLGLMRRVLTKTSANREVVRGFHIAAPLCASKGPDELMSDISVPAYKVPVDESSDVKRARLLYQSRKRGMLENDLLLGTFVDKYLFNWSSELLAQYDQLINSSYSDWDIYYWAVGSRPVPPQFDNQVMTLLQAHVKNDSKELRLRQPDLPLRLLNKE